MSRAIVQERRDFLRAALIAGTAILSPRVKPQPVFAEEPRSSLEKLNLAVIGVAARGAANLNAVAVENIVVLCDIDTQRLNQAAEKFPAARKLLDFREIFELPHIDAVVISTPDHTHAIPAALALKKRWPVYCEKPLTHSVYEARVLRRWNAQAQVPTQMGNQIHSDLHNYRRVVEIIRSGMIGEVRRIHVWQGGGVRPGKRVDKGEPPKHVHYDLWLGPAPYRPFHESHFHFNWRYWWDFGGGQLADFGCHYMDLPFWALELTAPQRIEAKGEKGHDGDNECPNFMQVDYFFPARAGWPPVHLTWYHGGWKPPGAEEYQKNSAVLFEGTEGKLLADYSTHKVFLADGRAAEMLPPSIPNSIGHHREWLRAIREGHTTGSHFEYAGRLTETVHLGNVAYRLGQAIEWDAVQLKVTNGPDAAEIINRRYREGWVLPEV
ncbi:MAG: oxidoreductase [Planctomycetaceae bacterium]|nr:MAG: oxidoreductase [Planctomycetaceae bacterium]